MPLSNLARGVISLPIPSYLKEQYPLQWRFRLEHRAREGHDLLWVLEPPTGPNQLEHLFLKLDRWEREKNECLLLILNVATYCLVSIALEPWSVATPPGSRTVRGGASNRRSSRTLWGSHRSHRLGHDSHVGMWLLLGLSQEPTTVCRTTDTLLGHVPMETRGGEIFKVHPHELMLPLTRISETDSRM